jgi:hypothetical protein
VFSPKEGISLNIKNIIGTAMYIGGLIYFLDPELYMHEIQPSFLPQVRKTSKESPAIFSQFLVP